MYKVRIVDAPQSFNCSNLKDPPKPSFRDRNTRTNYSFIFKTLDIKNSE